MGEQPGKLSRDHGGQLGFSSMAVVPKRGPRVPPNKNRSENTRIHSLFSCLHVRGSYPICAAWEGKIVIGSLEPYDECGHNVQILQDQVWEPLLYGITCSVLYLEIYLPA